MNLVRYSGRFLYLKHISARLYTWFAVTDTRNVCPTGWHVPSDAEWTTLTTYLGGESGAGGKLKETGTNHWLSTNTGATNETGFTTLPGGSRYAYHFFSNTREGDWGSSTEYSFTKTQAYYRNIYNNTSSINSVIGSKEDRYSIRCLKD